MKLTDVLLSAILATLVIAQTTERATPPAPVAPAVERPTPPAPAGVTLVSDRPALPTPEPFPIPRLSDLTTDISIGLHRYTILFFTDDSVESHAAFERAMALVKSHWHLVTVPITHPLAERYGFKAAPQFVALYDGGDVGCSDGATHADLYAMLTIAYSTHWTPDEAANAAAKVEEERSRAAAFESSSAAKTGWTVESLKAWLARYAGNKARGKTEVAGRTVLHHLTDPADPHKYPTALVAGLTAAEQQLLHDADHDGLTAPDGPLADPMTRPTAKKPPVKNLPPMTASKPKPKAVAPQPAVRYYAQPNCPNCVRPQTYWYYR